MPLYFSDRGLYPFQADHIAVAMTRPNNLMAWDTGLGKTHGAMATASFLIEDGVIDYLLMVVERNKMKEWAEDFRAFTDLEVAIYDGTPKRRQKLLVELPQVLIATYETARQDMVKKDPADSRKLSPNVLTDAYLGKRIMVAYDEMAKLGNRKSLLHRAHSLAIKNWRESGECRVLGLTATPMERNPVNYYNLGRILTPDTIGTVSQFTKEHVLDYDMFGNPNKFFNLPSLAKKMEPVLLRKRKTDPDVIDQFPKMVERFSYIDMEPEQKRFYDEVKDYLIYQDDPLLDQVGFTVLRMIAGHPASLLSSEGELANQFVQSVGVEAIKGMGSAKIDALVDHLNEVVVGQGAQVVVFSYYVSIIELIAKTLKKEGISFSVNHGQMSSTAREQSKSEFRSGAVNVFLTSSAGERGINLPEATYVVNFDLPTKHTSYLQRLNRISRIGNVKSDIVVAHSYIVRDSIEEGIAKLWLGRNYQSDILLDGDHDDLEDESFISSSDRRALLRTAELQGKK